MLTDQETRVSTAGLCFKCRLRTTNFRRFKALEEENAKLGQLLAEAMLSAMRS